MTETITYPVATDTVTVLGSRWKPTDPAWRGLLFRHPECSVWTQSTLMLAMVGRGAPHDLHLRVPFWHPENAQQPAPEKPDSFYRVRPHARAGGQWNKIRVKAVVIEPDPERDPPWRIVVTYAGKVRTIFR